MKIDHINPFYNLMLLADVAALVSTKDSTTMTEKKRKSKHLIGALSDEKNLTLTKLRKLTFSLHTKDSQKQPFPSPRVSKASDNDSDRRGPLRGIRRVMLRQVIAPPRVLEASGNENDDDWVRDMPAAMRERIEGNGGREMVLVLQKKLFATDVNKNNNRLSVPNGQLRTAVEQFVREGERVRLVEGLEVSLVDRENRDYRLSLTQWNMKTSVVYNLKSRWNSVVESNALKKGDLVQLWAFRSGRDELAFAVVNFL